MLFSRGVIHCIPVFDVLMRSWFEPYCRGCICERHGQGYNTWCCVTQREHLIDLVYLGCSSMSEEGHNKSKSRKDGFSTVDVFLRMQAVVSGWTGWLHTFPCQLYSINRPRRQQFTNLNEARPPYSCFVHSRLQVSGSASLSTAVQCTTQKVIL